MSFKPLTCIKIVSNGLEYIALVDGGANVSAVSVNLIKSLGLVPLIQRQDIECIAFNGQKTKFIGKFALDF